jgi:circadian clock protein KaiB
MTTLKGHARNKHNTDIGKSGRPKYILKLFVSGISQNSVRAVKNINRICEEYLKGNYQLEIIDIYQQPDLAIGEQIIVIPVLIIKHPLPEKRIIGDLSNLEKILEILNCNNN